MDNWIYAASLTGVFRMILIIFIIYAAATFVFRHIIPLLLRNYIQNLHQHTFHGDSSMNSSNKKKAGEVSVEYIDLNKQHPKPGNDDEYVDYEEIK